MDRFGEHKASADDLEDFFCENPTISNSSSSLSSGSPSPMSISSHSTKSRSKSHKLSTGSSLSPTSPSKMMKSNIAKAAKVITSRQGGSRMSNKPSGTVSPRLSARSSKSPASLPKHSRSAESAPSSKSQASLLTHTRSADSTTTTMPSKPREETLVGTEPSEQLKAAPKKLRIRIKLPTKSSGTVSPRLSAPSSKSQAAFHTHFRSADSTTTTMPNKPREETLVGTEPSEQLKAAPKKLRIRIKLPTESSGTVSPRLSAPSSKSQASFHTHFRSAETTTTPSKPREETLVGTEPSEQLKAAPKKLRIRIKLPTKSSGTVSPLSVLRPPSRKLLCTLTLDRPTLPQRQTSSESRNRSNSSRCHRLPRSCL
jgi:hypothetical protein